MAYTYKQLFSSDIASFKNLLKLFGEVFKDQESYQNSIPNDKYIEDFLNDARHIVLIAQDANGRIVGGQVAYELKKFEQERSEIFVYDLAVLKEHQRHGIATKLFDELKIIAKKKNAYIIFVEADDVDEGAISFYRSLKATEIKTHHFDVEV